MLDALEITSTVYVCDSCGDGFIDKGEVCDDSNLNGNTCLSLGFTGGPLRCSDRCTALDTSRCGSAGDADGDEVPNATDNCPDAFNPDQLDSDADGHGDACDTCADVPNPDGNCPSSIYELGVGRVAFGRRSAS